MLNCKRGEMSIRNEVRDRLSVMEQVSQNDSMAICRQRNPHRWNCKPLSHLRPRTSDAERAIKDFWIGPNPDKCEEGRPGQSYLLPTIQLIFQPVTCLLMVGIIFDLCIEQEIGIN